MIKDIVQGHWKEIKGDILKQWGKFTKDEIDVMHGTYLELQGHLQKKYGYSKEQAKKELDMYLNKRNFH